MSYLASDQIYDHGGYSNESGRAVFLCQLDKSGRGEFRHDDVAGSSAQHGQPRDQPAHMIHCSRV